MDKLSSKLHNSNKNYWSKRTAAQYAGKKVLGIDPNITAAREAERAFFFKGFENSGMGILERINHIDKLVKEGKLATSPIIPNDKILEYVLAKAEWENKYG